MQISKVILADDDADDRDLFELFYETRSDIKLLPSVENGIELIDCLKKMTAVDDLPDLIVLYQNMPKMNGKQTLQFLKSDKRFAHIPTVVYSTYTDSNLISECIRLGANHVALKPMDNEGYQKMMDDFLRKSHSPHL